jgi:nitrate/TMAO reductase-like tetraheme cytochrome c subunit
MKRILFAVFMITGLLGLYCFVIGDRAVEAAKPEAAACKTCHANIASVLPPGHPPAKGADMAACISCHAPDRTGATQKNPFSSRMHRAHIAPNGSLDCTACHTWIPGKTFGLIGQRGSWGTLNRDDMALMKEIFSSWAGSSFMDNLHARAGIACAQCHGKGLPKADDTVENDRCLTCHGPMDQLAQKTVGKEFEDRNPHKSHLGEIACTVCHKGHAASKVYCLDCHRNFKMTIQGATKP